MTLNEISISFSLCVLYVYVMHTCKYTLVLWTQLCAEEVPRASEEI